MKLYRIPQGATALLFDVDGTLYSNADYAKHQSDVLVHQLATTRGWSIAQAESEIARSKAAIFEASKKHTSLGNAMAALGVDTATSIQWRTLLIKPDRFLKPDMRLRAALQQLATAGFSLAVVTNNPRAIALATLEALGVADLFPVRVCLDDTHVSKPAPQPYLEAARLCGAQPSACISIGDRYDVDLAEPLALGMGAVLVDGVQDLYALPDMLLAETGNHHA